MFMHYFTYILYSVQCYAVTIHKISRTAFNDGASKTVNVILVICLTLAQHPSFCTANAFTESLFQQKKAEVTLMLLET